MDQRGTDAKAVNGDRLPARVRVFIVDDHVLFRNGLRALLEEHDLDPVGDVGDAEQAFGPILRLKPDVVLMPERKSKPMVTLSPLEAYA